MKNIKRIFGVFTVVALLCTSCSKEEDVIVNDSQKSTLSFGALLNDLVSNKASLKQAVNDIPECSDAAPAFVEVVLSGPTNVGTMMTPLVVEVNPAPGDYDNDGEVEYFTKESVDLELEPGEYSLEFFAVYDGDPEVVGSNRIWIAPMTGGSLAAFVDNPLPMDIVLGAGVKKYVDVEVLCFDDRTVNEYGYLFFDLETTEAMEFCFFANYCDDNGRHFPAAYHVNVWLGDDSSGIPLYSETNVTGIGNPNDEYNDNDPYAEPLCLALPDLSQFEDDEEYLYYEVTLMAWDEVYGEVTSTMIPGHLSRNKIESNFDGTDGVNYEHLRFGCGDDDGEPLPDDDNDGVPNNIDECPNTPVDAEVDEVGCVVNGETDSDGDGVPDSIDQCPDTEEDAEVNEWGCAVNGEDDTDGDGVPDSIDECPNTPEGEEVNNVGCTVDTGSDCIDEAGDIIVFDQTVDIANFPVGQNPFYYLQVGGENVGTITFNLDTAGANDQLIILIDMFDGTAENSFTDYTILSWELNLPGLSGEEICVSGISESEFEITYDSSEIEDVIYPIDVEFRANYVIAME